MSRVNDLDQILAELEAEESKNLEDIKKAEEVKKIAQERVKNTKETKKKVSQAREKMQEAEEMLGSVNVPNIDKNTKDNNRDKNNNVLNLRFGSGFLAGVVAISLLGGAYVLGRKSLTGPVKVVSEVSDTTNNEENFEINDTTNEEENFDLLTYNEEYETLTTEEFESLCADRIKAFEEASLPVSEKDIVTYLVCANSDKIAEDNEELITLVVSEKSPEESINDFGKVCAAIAMKDFQLARGEQNADNFIRVSDSIFGEQKDSMLKIEEYVEEIVSSQKDNDKVNALVSELFEELNSGSLSKLDDGVGFAMATYLMVLDAMDKSGDFDLTSENADMLAQLITSEKYVSNIMTILVGCQETNAKSLTK